MKLLLLKWLLIPFGLSTPLQLRCDYPRQCGFVSACQALSPYPRSEVSCYNNLCHYVNSYAVWTPCDLPTCPPGFYTSGSLNYACPDGSFCLGGSSPAVTCSQCPDFYFPSRLCTPTSDTVCTKCLNMCKPGQYVKNLCTASSPVIECGVCDLGFFCPTGGVRSLCTGGSWCANSTLTEPCPAGFSCPPGSYFPIPCLPGQSCGPKTVYPSLCSAAHMCPNASTMLPCPPGSLCPPGSSYAAPCPFGYSCVDKTYAVLCTPVYPGQFLISPCTSTNNTVTSPCPVNNYCLGDNATFKNCTVCQKGFYIASACSPSADTVCVACEPGSFCGNGVTKTSCTECNLPIYLTKTPCNSTSDAICLYRDFQCRVCPPNSVCYKGVKPPLTCSVAPPGYYHFRECRPSNDTVIFSCPKGKYCLGGFSSPQLCTPCPAQQYVSQACNVSSDTKCLQCSTTCPLGYYQSSPCNAISDRKCSICPAGSWCGDQFTITPCLRGEICPPGTHQRQWCLPGNWCTANATKMQLCAAGVFCPRGTVTPIPCPLPFCDFGQECSTHYCPAGSSAPIPCPASGYTCTDPAKPPTPCFHFGEKGYQWLNDYACGFVCEPGDYFLNVSDHSCTQCTQNLTCEPGTHPSKCTRFNDSICTQCSAPCGEFNWTYNCEYNCMYGLDTPNVCAPFRTTTAAPTTSTTALVTTSSSTTPDETTSTPLEPTTPPLYTNFSETNITILFIETSSPWNFTSYFNFNTTEEFTTTTEPDTTTTTPTTTPEPTPPETTPEIPPVFQTLSTKVEVQNTTEEICADTNALIQAYNQALENVSNTSFTSTITELNGLACYSGSCWACVDIAPPSQRRLLQTASQVVIVSVAVEPTSLQQALSVNVSDIVTSLSASGSSFSNVKVTDFQQDSCVNSDAASTGCQRVELIPLPDTASSSTSSSSSVDIVPIAIGAGVGGGVLICLMGVGLWIYLKHRSTQGEYELVGDAKGSI